MNLSVKSLHGRMALPLYRSRRIFRRYSSTVASAIGPAGALVDWVQRGGGTVNGVVVKSWDGADGGSGYGLQAAATCPAGTQLISLPSNLQLTYGSTTDPKVLSLISKVPTELWGAKLALQLLADRVKGTDATFAPYIAALPLGFPGLPMFFPPEEITALQYPPVTEQVKRRCRWLLGFTSDVLTPIRGTSADPFEGVEIDANALGWALAAVTSRAFRVRGPEYPAAMLPLIDMCNHSFEPNAKIQGTSSGTLAMVTTREVAAGEPILISYGALPNDFLLLDYGFIIPDNPYDTVQLRFDRNLVEASKAVANVGSTIPSGTKESDGLGGQPIPPLPAWQTKALESLGLAGSGANTEVSMIQLIQLPSGAASASAGGCPVDARLLGGVRVLCAANAGELGSRSGVEALGSWDSPLSLRNEIATLRTLSGMALICLSQFQGTAEDDVEVLRHGIDPKSKGPLSSDMQLAVRFRLEKKRLLEAALKALAGRIKEFSEGGAVVAGSGSTSGGGAKGKNKSKAGKAAGPAATSKGFGR